MGTPSACQGQTKKMYKKFDRKSWYQIPKSLDNCVFCKIHARIV